MAVLQNQDLSFNDYTNLCHLLLKIVKRVYSFLYSICKRESKKGGKDHYERNCSLQIVTFQINTQKAGL